MSQRRGEPDDPIARAIARKLKKPVPSKAAGPKKPEPQPRPDEEPATVAELVAPPAAAVCTACLTPVSTSDMARGAAEDLRDGRVHCRRCLSKLRSGLLCLACYKPIPRAELVDGRAVARGDRAFHSGCAPREPAQAAPSPAPPAAARASLTRGAPILGPGAASSRGPSDIQAALSPRPGKLAVKCCGCFTALSSSYFAKGRAVVVDGRAFCTVCATRAGLHR